MAALLLTACDDPRIDPQIASPDAAVRGRSTAAALGCGACHDMPGVWPRGSMAPSLARFADRAFIAGKLPNRPDLLAAYLLNPQGQVPGTAMPQITMTASQAADIAAYLHSSDER